MNNYSLSEWRIIGGLRIVGLCTSHRLQFLASDGHSVKRKAAIKPHRALWRPSPQHQRRGTCRQHLVCRTRNRNTEKCFLFLIKGIWDKYVKWTRSSITGNTRAALRRAIFESPQRLGSQISNVSMCSGYNKIQSSEENQVTKKCCLGRRFKLLEVRQHRWWLYQPPAVIESQLNHSHMGGEIQVYELAFRRKKKRTQQCNWCSTNLPCEGSASISLITCLRDRHHVLSGQQRQCSPSNGVSS